MFDFLFKKKDEPISEAKKIIVSSVEEVKNVNNKDTIDNSNLKESKISENYNYELPDLNLIENEHIKYFIKDICKNDNIVVPLGLENGEYYVETLESMPNLIVGGTVMSGKSSFIHTLIGSIMMYKKPYEVKFLICDSKKIEYSQYNGIPYLLTQVIYDSKKVEIALDRIKEEINNRINILKKAEIKNIVQYNKTIDEKEKIPSYIIIIDDYDMFGNEKIDNDVWYIAKNGWNVNVFLILVSNHPSSEIISSMSKSHIPARLCFKVPSVRDSMLILDDSNASKISGIGTALYKSRYVDDSKKISVKILSEDEISNLISYSKQQQDVVYDDKWTRSSKIYEDDYDDPLYDEIVEFVITSGKASASLLQRRFKLGYERAAKLVDILEARGIIGPQNGSKPREVLVKLESQDEEIPM